MLIAETVIDCSSVNRLSSGSQWSTSDVPRHAVSHSVAQWCPSLMWDFFWSMETVLGKAAPDERDCRSLAVQPSVTVHSLLSVHGHGTAYHLTFEHLHHHSTRLRNIWNPTSFNCLSLACRACDYVYIDYVRRSRSSLYHLLCPMNCQTYITLHIEIWRSWS